MGDSSGCQFSNNNLAVYLQGVDVMPSPNITTEYFVTATLPSAAVGRRVWQFIAQGTLTELPATLVLDYTKAHENCPSFNITFENPLNGTLIIHNQTFSANKFMTYAVDPENQYILVLTVEKMPKKIVQCYGADSKQNYYFNVNVDDCKSGEAC
jgi:hypothetical protein